MSTAIADVLKAVDGGAVTGATTLAFCVIDYLAYLRPVGRKGGKSYRKLVKDFLTPIDSRYNPADIYALRCSLVHTYAEAEALSKAGIDSFFFTHRQPENHLLRESRYIVLNHDTFVADVIWAAHRFFETVRNDAGVERRANGLISIRTGVEMMVRGANSEDVQASRSYTGMHHVLAELDEADPSLQNLRTAVTGLYPAPW